MVRLVRRTHVMHYILGESQKLTGAMIHRVNNLHHQHARLGFIEDPSKPRHLLRVWLRDNELSPELPLDIKHKFDTMFSEEPKFFPVDEIEEDEKRRQTGVFTAVCKEETAEERLKSGGIGAEIAHLLKK